MKNIIIDRQEVVGVILFIFCFSIILGSLPSNGSEAIVSKQDNEKPPLKVLFIGNSQMAAYDLPGMIQAMAESAPAGRPRIEAGRAIVGGMSLKKCWETGLGEGTARAMIAAEIWDYVVIQEIYAQKGNRPDPQEFEDYATRFDHAIKSAGSKTVVFATASVTEFYIRSYHYPDEFKALNDMQIAFGKKFGIPVAAAGYAWMRYLGPNPAVDQRLDLYAPDKGHPGAKGTYIYACLLYAVLTGLNPDGLAHEFKNIRGGISVPGDEALKMQKAAWEQYQENKSRFSRPGTPEKLFKQSEAISKFKAELAVPGKFTADMEECEKRVNALEMGVREKIIESMADMMPGLTGETWRCLVEAAESKDAEDRRTALRVLIMSVPADKITALANDMETRARFEPAIRRMRELYKGQKWQALVDEFKDTDVSGWPDDWASEALLMRGEGRYNLKNGREAEADLQKAIGRFPASIPSSRPPPVITWFRLAENYQQNLKDNQKALEAYIKVNEMARSENWWMPVAAVMRAADILRSLGRDDEALKMLETAGRDKKDSRVCCAYLDALAAMGRKEDAIAWCKKMMQFEGLRAADKEALGKKLRELESNAGQPPQK